MRPGQSNQWGKHRPKWIRLAGIAEEDLEGETKALVASINPLCEPGKRWKTETVFPPSLALLF